MELTNPTGQPANQTNNTRVDSLRVRCPKCTKLYMVQMRDIHETRPRFECVSCHERFWISYPECLGAEEVTGLRIDQLEVKMPAAVVAAAEGLKPSEDNCPKCHKSLQAGMEDCPHCGVIPAKFLGLKTASRIQGSERLSVQWKKIIDDYENEDLHQQFIKISSMENNLAYASAQYAQLLKLIPHDERAAKMIREIEALVSVPISQTSKVRVYATKQKTPRWVQGALVVGAVVVAVGIFVPMLRQLTGFGAVLLFLGAGYKLKILNF